MIIISEDPANPWDEDAFAVATSDMALWATLLTSEGHEDGAVLQAYDVKCKPMQMGRDARTQRKLVLTNEWRRHLTKNLGIASPIT